MPIRNPTFRIVRPDSFDLPPPKPPKQRIYYDGTKYVVRDDTTPADTDPPQDHTESMSEITRDEFHQTLSAVEERMDKRVDRMRDETDRRSDTFLRELALRDEAFRREQAIREKALDDRYASFLIAQAERDKRFDESVSTIRSEIGRLGNLKLNVWGAMLTAVGLGIAIAALATTLYQTGRGDAPAAPSHVISAPSTQPSSEPKPRE